MPTSRRLKVELTDEQIAFLREDLRYTKQRFRDEPYERMPHEQKLAHRNERLAMVESIEQALREAR